MENGKKPNVPLIVALSIPLLMVALTALTIYLPALFIQPRFDLVYTPSIRGPYCVEYYRVENQRIVVEKKEKDPRDPEPSCESYRQTPLFYYDIQRQESREITLEEAKELIIHSARSHRSPDGFEIVRGGDGFDLFFFGGHSYRDIYLKKGAYTRKLYLTHHFYDYYHSLNPVGWVERRN